MKRLCVTVIGLVFSIAAAEAESPSVAPTKPARAHPAKMTMIERVAPKTQGIAGVNFFSDPYAPPAGAHKTAMAQFPSTSAHRLVEPQGGFSLRAGRDNPDEPMTGGLKFRF